MKKKLLLSALIILVCIFHIQAQWTQLTTTGTIAELRSAYFTNSQTGYVVGSDSFVHKTTDAGASWNAVVSVANDTLRSVFFTDDTTGYAVGAKGNIIKTTDAGNTWTLQVSNSSSLLRSVHFPTHETGYVAGGGGTVLKTTDGGASWVPQASGTIQDLISIRFLNADTGYVVSSLSTFLSGLILKTVDGGNTWDTVYTYANGFLSVSLAGNDSVVYAVGGMGSVVKSTDAGQSWTIQTSGVATNVNLRATWFHSPDTGYASGDLGTLIYTTDGGNLWVSQTFPGISGVGLLGLYFPMSDTGYAVGTAGTVIRYSKPCALPAEPGQITGGTTVCEGATINYTIQSVPGALSYTWSGPPGSTIINGQGDTLVTLLHGNTSGNISVTADNLCGASVPHMLTIIVNPLPATPTITNNGTFLISSPASTYQWYFNNTAIPGADSVAFTPQQNGQYSVSITNSFGCTATSASITIINAGIASPSVKPIRISPHPFTDHFTISFLETEAGNGLKQLIITDINGRLVKTLSFEGLTSQEIDASGFSKGIYFYELQINLSVYKRGKLIKQ